MSIYQTYIDPTSTAKLLSNLSKAIEETKLVRTIQTMQESIYQFEKKFDVSERSNYLRQEVRKLQEKLDKLRLQSMR